MNAEVTFTTGRAWFDSASGTLWGGSASFLIRIAVEASAVTSNGKPRIYFFAGAGPGAFRTLEGEAGTRL